MSVARLGELSIGAAVPLLATFHASLQAAIGFALPELQAKLAGLAQVSAALTIAPPDLTGTISAALATVASLQAAVSGPTVTLEITAIASLIAELGVQLATIEAAAALSIPSASLSLYAFEGPTGSFGAELQTALNEDLPGAPANTFALVLATTVAASWAAAQAVFRTS